ncbi:MAG: hypothetical protein L6Q81_08040 [Bacteroidia bacterium]|nr:hypothetical protein [Bacteroidia bacterium]
MSLRNRYRLHQFGNRLQVFLLGLLLGVILAGGFFLLKVDQYIKELAVVKSFTEPDKAEETIEDETGKVKTDNKKKSKSQTTDKVTQESDFNSDSLGGDSTLPAVFQTSDGDEIVVKKEQLLGERVVSLINLDGGNAIDSIRSKEAGINEVPGKSLTVEFWQSPLNYRGYKLTRNRLVLFGFASEDPVSLFRLENNTYLSSNNGVFRLETTSDFRQLERVTDETVLNRLQ